MRKYLTVLLITLLTASLISSAAVAKKGGKKMAFTIKSSAFKDMEYIPARYSGGGENISPPLNIGDTPAGAKSFALIVDDPDAPSGTFTHWVIFNAPAETKEIKEGELPAGALSGRNTAGRSSYYGPNPPPGKPHHYIFKLFALNSMLNLSGGASKADVWAAMKGHIIAEAKLTGLFKR